MSTETSLCSYGACDEKDDTSRFLRVKERKIEKTNKKSRKLKKFPAFFLVEETGFESTTLWSRTQRATSCATPRFFNFLSIFVSGQTCGQATYFERFVEKYTDRIVSVVKGFRGSNKSTKESPCGCPEKMVIEKELHLFSL